jgi:light-regulated signal transduction histidine kinase (bacteriophytochrome)
VRDELGQIACWVGMDADITEIKKAEHALRIANTELEAFSYSVSHDLRSPLATLQGLSRHLARRLSPGNDAQALHYLERIGVAALQMGDLIDGLLALAQVSRRSLQREPVDLALMAHHIVDQLRKHEPGREVELVVGDALTVNADRRMVRSLMDNLLGNAWKFSAQRERARIEIGREPGPGEPVFFVRDNGAGFDMAHAGQLFGTFQRLHDANEFPGTGIGLATVQRIVARHQGRVWAEAAPSAGATFYFTLGAEG